MSLVKCSSAPFLPQVLLVTGHRHPVKSSFQLGFTLKCRSGWAVCHALGDLLSRNQDHLHFIVIVSVQAFQGGCRVNEAFGDSTALTVRSCWCSGEGEIPQETTPQGLAVFPF